MDFKTTFKICWPKPRAYTQCSNLTIVNPNCIVPLTMSHPTMPFIVMWLFEQTQFLSLHNPKISSASINHRIATNSLPSLRLHLESTVAPLCIATASSHQTFYSFAAICS
ncbi:hypothetical protein JHK85_023224 [Glycine max]|nr:hypothetical protein JHK85_023224 [Glycine max]